MSLDPAMIRTLVSAPGLNVAQMAASALDKVPVLAVGQRTEALLAAYEWGKSADKAFTSPTINDVRAFLVGYLVEMSNR